MRPTSAEYTSQCTRRTKNRKTRAQQITHKTVKENKNTTTHTVCISNELLHSRKNHLFVLYLAVEQIENE